MGGGSSAVRVEPVPEKQATKGLSAAATAAAEAQREKRRKSRGLTASILTKRADALAAWQKGAQTLG